MPGIDVHTHLAPRIAEGAVPGVEPTAEGRLSVDGHTVGPPDLYRPEALVAWLRERSLDAAAVSAPPPFFRQGLDAGATRAWVRASNEGLLGVVEPWAGAPGVGGGTSTGDPLAPTATSTGDPLAPTAAASPRLLPLAYLPLDHPEVALAEYARVRADARWAGLVASAGGRSVSLADERLEPLWRALDDDARLLLLHPGTSPDPRLDAFYLHNLLGNPIETAVAVAQLIFGDVLPRFPRMRVLLVHCGGCAGGQVGRWERGVATARPGLAPLTESLREAVRRLHVDCLAHDPLVVSQAVELFGPDKLVLGSDWPFPMGIEDPSELIAHLDPELRARVAVDNARAALGLGAETPAAG